MADASKSSVKELTPRPEDYVSVELGALRRLPRAVPCDVFLQLSADNFVRVFSRNTGLDYQRLSQYEVKGVVHAYIRRDDHEEWRAYASRTLRELMAEPGIPDSDRAAALLQLTDQTLADVFIRVNVSSESAEAVAVVVRGVVERASHSPKSLALLLKMVSHGDYLYYHSVATAVFALFLARAAGTVDRSRWETLGQGAFLANIGMVQVPAEIHEAPRALSPAERKLVERHPAFSLRMLQDAGEAFPEEVRWIAYQHHEQPGGAGYPNKLARKAIYPLALFVGLADCFSALISKRPWREAYSVRQAVKILQDEGDKHDRSLVNLLSNLSLGSSQPAAPDGGTESRSSSAA